MVRNAILGMPFQTQRPLGLRTYLYRSEDEEFVLRWRANFETRTLLIITPRLWPSTMLDFLSKLPAQDERFAQVGISTAMDINEFFCIKVCREVEDRERWFEIRVKQYQGYQDIDIDSLPRWRFPPAN
jgi:hypothetical protein